VSQGLPVADSSSPVTAELISAATQLFGAAPAAWGRYFTGPTTAGTVEYRHAAESAVLAAAGIRLLPVARQTRDVGSGQQHGVSDAQQNVADLLDTFTPTALAAQGGEFLLFLDVEGNPSAGSPSLALDYYLGWAETVTAYSRSQTDGAVTVLPAVYARQGDDATWNVLVAAQAQGAACHGVWVARYYYSSCSMTDWDSALVQPDVALPFDIPLWQYAENCCQGRIDCSQTNPTVDIQTLLLDRLIRP
jgi:hypothetical protein